MKNESKIYIQRFGNYPLIYPDYNHQWMSIGVMNCGVVFDKSDRLFKMLFRATGRRDHLKSSLGFAFSKNGRQWTWHKDPVLQSGINEHCCGGVEDPRIVQWIDGHYYVFTTVIPKIERKLVIRIGIWRTKNFREFEWVGMPFEKVSAADKNSAIIPEPIDGFAYLLHRRGGQHIWLSRTDDLTLRTEWRDSRILLKKDAFYRHPEYGSMPARIGIAGPPIRTPKGWLLITHVAHKPRIYSLGFAMLDGRDPTRVTYIHHEPILVPEALHERLIGYMPNVVFSCATVDANKNDLYVYWGGADTVIYGGRLRKKNLPMCY